MLRRRMRNIVYIFENFNENAVKAKRDKTDLFVDFCGMSPHGLRRSQTHKTRASDVRKLQTGWKLDPMNMGG
jgi:hypothetical protein